MEASGRLYDADNVKAEIMSTAQARLKQQFTLFLRKKNTG